MKFNTLPLDGEVLTRQRGCCYICPRPKRQIHQLLLRHRSTPPDAFAHDHDRQQVSWLAGYRLGPPSQGYRRSPVASMAVSYPPTVAGAAADLHINLRAPHSLG